MFMIFGTMIFSTIVGLLSVKSEQREQSEQSEQREILIL